MHTLFRTLLTSAALLLCQTASAVVINGTIGTIDGNGDGEKAELKVARVAFTVSADTRLFFDSLVMEPHSDLNGDGHITGFDNVMRLFDGGTQLTWNDDSSFTYDDGSQHLYDSAFGWTFAKAGTYIVTLGKRGYDEADALRGYQKNQVYQPYYGHEAFGAWRLGLNLLAGSVDNVHEIGTEVPEPGTLALFGAGLLGAGWLRRRRR
ncbi:DVUA0089 family protein [Massilia sp. Leaf139]|uniref:DVUA0089 family protein n=1 Tax=Massilia sp. Leaf139 TaxID=1736272 RepID=UPI0006F24C76|nr:DVUA0089 family protein [Massilia sp. Leaf139]KQQ86622.1 hypothetical protein ASF77_20190 [Massilia sp. Leaf139]